MHAYAICPKVSNFELLDEVSLQVYLQQGYILTLFVSGSFFQYDSALHHCRLDCNNILAVSIPTNLLDATDYLSRCAVFAG